MLDSTPNSRRRKYTSGDKEGLQRIMPPIERVSVPRGAGEGGSLATHNGIHDAPDRKQRHYQENDQAQNWVGVGVTEPIRSHRAITFPKRETHQRRVEDTPEMLHMDICRPIRKRRSTAPRNYFLPLSSSRTMVSITGFKISLVNFCRRSGLILASTRATSSSA
jgi:hypothetical protein